MSKKNKQKNPASNQMSPDKMECIAKDMQDKKIIYQDTIYRAWAKVSDFYIVTHLTAKYPAELKIVPVLACEDYK